MGKKKPTPPPELFVILKNYRFPGNIRELKGMIYNAVGLHSGGILSCESFREYISEKMGKPIADPDPAGISPEFRRNDFC